MLTFKYTARDPATGEKITALVEADSEQAAAKVIHSKGLSLIEIKLKDGGGDGFVSKLTHRVKAKDKVLFSRQLSTLINAGLPLVQSLRNVAGQTQNKTLQSVINQVIKDVEGGAAFSVALGKHPEIFNAIFVNLVAAGEVSGTLDKTLERVANQQEKDAEILSKIRGAMVYPIIVMFVMLAVVIFMVVKVLPAVEEVYKGIQGATLPLVTRIMLGVSHFTTKYWWIVLIVVGALVFFTTRYARTGGGKEVIDKLKMKLWPFGPLFMKMYMARFSRVGSTLVASGVPLIQMLDITAKAINNVHIERTINAAAEKVKGGKSLSEALKDNPNFLTLVPDMLRIGEQSGSIEQMLGKTADYYEREVDNEIRAISTTIEPLLMIIMGLVAILIVTAVLLPVYSLVGKNF